MWIVLLAAGGSRRFGSPKLLAPVDGVPMVRRAAEAARGTGAALLVVTGAYHDAVRAALAGVEATFVDNPDWESGMGASIAAAFRHLAAVPGIEAAIVCPSDLPLVGTTQLLRLVDAHRASPDRILASHLGSSLGPPCLFPRRWFAELAGLSGTQGARALLDRYGDDVQSIAMPEAALDVDTPSDLASITR